MKGSLHAVLGLAHHRHTAQPLAHHHTSYRALFVVLAVVGLTMVSIQSVAAADYGVSAVVPGDTLTSAAIITSPADGDTISMGTVEVKGICQNVNTGTLVILVRGLDSIGAGMCQSDSTFHISVTLDRGENILFTKVETGAGGSGPDGVMMRILYQPAAVAQTVSSQPVAAATGSLATQATIPQAPEASLRIKPKSELALRQQLDSAFTVQFAISGGMIPYSIEVDWGDGHTERRDFERGGDAISLAHTYTVPGIHTVIVKATDARGDTFVVQYIAYAYGVAHAITEGKSAVALPVLQPNDWTSIASVVWTSYILASLGVIVIWLVSPRHSFALHLFVPGHVRTTDGRRAMKSKQRHG